MTRIRHTICPWCGKVHDRVSGIAKKGTPQEPVAENGDATFCIGCGQPSIFANWAEGGLRFPLQNEFEEIAASQIASKVQQAFASLPGDKLRPILRRPEWM